MSGQGLPQGPQPPTVPDPTPWPLVSIVIPAFNKYPLTRRCLRTIEGPTLEVIVVDNGSSDGTREHLWSEFPQVAVIRNPTNLGYAGGCNVGVRAARGDFIFVLNNDTQLIDPDILERFVRTMTADPTVAAVGPRLVYYDDHNRVVYDGHNPYGFRDISGAAFMVSRKALEEVGLFDESFFAYFEDHDLQARLRRAGWSLRHVPTARIAQMTLGTSEPGSRFYIYWHSWNFLVFMRRYATIRYLLLKVFPIWLNLFGHFIRGTFKRRDWGALAAWARGNLNGIRAALAVQPVKGPPLEREAVGVVTSGGQGLSINGGE